MAINIFNAHSGKKLTPLQRLVYKVVNRWMPVFIFGSVLGGMICGTVYVIMHFLVKYW